MLMVQPEGATNSAHCDLGRNGELEESNLEHAELETSDSEQDQEEASPRKKMRGPPGLDNQLAQDDECMEEWTRHEEGEQTPDTVFLRDTVLREMVVRCGDKVGRLVPVEECEKTYSVMTDEGENVGKLILYVDDVIMTGIGEWVEATMAAIGEGWDSKTDMMEAIRRMGKEPTTVHIHRENQDEPTDDTVCQECYERPATHICIGFRGTRYACGKRLCVRCLYRGTSMCQECATERGHVRSVKPRTCNVCALTTTEQINETENQQPLCQSNGR